MVNRNLDISTGLDRSMIADVSTIAWRHVHNALVSSPQERIYPSPHPLLPIITSHASKPEIPQLLPPCRITLSPL